MSNPARPTEPFTSRRTVIRTAGLVALAGGSAAALGACSADAETAAPTASSSAPAAPSASSAPSSAEASPASPSASTSQAPSGPSVATADVKVGGGVVLKDANYVITQPKEGEFKAFSKICTHKGCPVAEVADGTINCKCHGSKFSIEDGSVANPPATKPLTEAKVTVAGSKVYVTG